MISVIVINRSLATALGIGVLFVAAVLGWVFYQQRGARLELTGSILKARTAAMDDTSTVIVLDFRVRNSSGYPLTLRSMTLEMDAADGSVAQGTPIAGADIPRMFQFYKFLGEPFNPVLRERDTMPAQQTIDRMTAFQLAVPLADVEHRTNLRLRLEDSTSHAVVELKEK
jgi:hypothetical protein